MRLRNGLSSRLRLMENQSRFWEPSLLTFPGILLRDNVAANEWSLYINWEASPGYASLPACSLGKRRIRKQCASCRDCTLEAMRTQVTANHCFEVDYEVQRRDQNRNK